MDVKPEMAIPLVMTNKTENNTEMLKFLIEKIKQSKGYQYKKKMTKIVVNSGFLFFVCSILVTISPVFYFMIKDSPIHVWEYFLSASIADVVAIFFSSLFFGLVFGGFFSMAVFVCLEDYYSTKHYMQKELKKLMRKHFEVNFDEKNFTDKGNFANFISLLEALTDNKISQFCNKYREFNLDFAKDFIKDVKKMGLQKGKLQNLK